MKYARTLLLAGSKALDADRYLEIEGELAKLRNEEEQILQDYHDEVKTVEKIAEDIINRLIVGKRPYTREELAHAFARPQRNGKYHETFYGLDKNSLDRVRKQISEREGALKRAAGPSQLTTFLENILDETVSDYALKSVGLGAPIAQILIRGVEVERERAVGESEGA